MLVEGWYLLFNVWLDVMLVDFGLFDGYGSELIKEVQCVLFDCEVMVVIVFGDEVYVLVVIEVGVIGYLLKDVMLVEIVDQLCVFKVGGSLINVVIVWQMLCCLVVWVQVECSSQELVDGSVDDVGLLLLCECEVLQFCVKGYSYEEIVLLLNVLCYMVMSFVKCIYCKLQVYLWIEVVYEVWCMGLLCD